MKIYSYVLASDLAIIFNWKVLGSYFRVIMEEIAEHSWWYSQTFLSPHSGFSATSGCWSLANWYITCYCPTCWPFFPQSCFVNNITTFLCSDSASLKEWAGFFSKITSQINSSVFTYAKSHSNQWLIAW